MSHCSFCLQLYQVQLLRKGHSSSLPGSPGCGFSHSSLSPSQKQPHMLCPHVIYWAYFSGQDRSGGYLHDASWDFPETFPHWSQLVTRDTGCFWSFAMSPCVFWHLEILLSFLGVGQHFSFLLWTPGSVCVTVCQLPSSRGGPEVGPWPYVSLVCLHYLRVSVFI